MIKMKIFSYNKPETIKKKIIINACRLYTNNKKNNNGNNRKKK